MRLWRVLLLVFLVSGGLWLETPAARAVGAWQPAAPYPDTQVPFGGTVTLPDGQVLVLGFVGVTAEVPAHGSAARYDPATDSWRATAPLDFRQGYASPVLLNEGRVLVTGGSVNEGISPGGRTSLRNTQLYDPIADGWSSAGAMNSARSGHTATLLPDGSVLVVGGDSSSGSGPSFPLASTERYTAHNGQWSAAAALAQSRAFHTATRLADGRVLVVGGVTGGASGYSTETVATAEIFDPATGNWSSAAAMATPRVFHTATLLGDGRVLVFGGLLPEDANTAEIYDPATNRWMSTTPGNAKRIQHGVVTLADGGALVVGGDVEGTVERFDPATQRWVGLPPHPAGAIGRSAHRLPDGRVLIAGTAPVGSALFIPEPSPAACFAETGHCVRGRFLTYWLENGGLARNGFPLTDERVEVLEDGRAYTVQYFERVRMEYHPENAGTPYEVLLGHFGRRVLRAQIGGANNAVALFEQAIAPATPIVGVSYFAETGHNLGGRFRDYWLANGGLAQFGYPITEERRETLEDFNEYTVQYFERGRLEHHPENAGTPYEVLLGQFGRRIEGEARLLDGDFEMLYFGDQRLRDRLGAPTSAVWTMPGALQEFERGRMFWLGDVTTISGGGDYPSIYVFAGGAASGSVVNFGPLLEWPDTWREGEEVGGGPGPRPGLTEPARGFGKVWRQGSGLLAPGLPPSSDVRDQLGYAIAPESGYQLRYQTFNGGMLVSTPDERIVYAIFTNRPSNGSALLGTYERYEVPAR
jgi:N-acetylneuraminic acid mutarotase